MCTSQIIGHVIILYVSNDLKHVPGSARICRNLAEVRHLVQIGTSSTRAVAQDDVSSNKLPQTTGGGAGARFR